MTKSNRLYKIFMTTMIVIIAGMLLATGIIAIQKSMKLNVSMSMLPTADIEILVGGAESETLLFRNFDKDTNNKVYVDTSKATLSGNTFSLKDSFVNSCGSEFTIIVKNYSNFSIKVGLSSTATVEGVENATGIPATITPASQSLAACSSYTSPTSAEFSVTIEAVMTQTTNLTIVISEVSIATLKTGVTVNAADPTLVVFDYWSAEYEAIVGDWSSSGTAIDVDNAGKIKLFSVGTERYILSESEIYANASCQNMFSACASLANITFNNFNTSNVSNMMAMFALCTSLKTLDLSSFETVQNPISITNMFNNCTKLETIYVDDEKWDSSKVSGSGVFVNAAAIKGGAGTTYVGTNAGVTSDYAKIDGGTESPGYFTDIADKSSKFTVIYDANGGSGTMANQKISVGVSTALTTNTFTYEGYTFEGWSTSASGTVVYTDGQSVTNLASAGQTITLYAVWEADTPVVSYATLASVTKVGSAITNTATSVIFGYWNDYKSLVGNDWTTGAAIDVDGAGTIKIFSGTSDANAKYILSESEIYANAGCINMFSQYTSLTNIEFNNFNTSKVTNMAGMFYGCTNLIVLDLSGWDTSKVTHTGFYNGGIGMFAGCTNLKTIYVSDLWSNESVTMPAYMFNNCTSLVGGNGTVYDANYIDDEYAYIDAPGTPGYFTHIDFKDAPTLTLNFSPVEGAEDVKNYVLEYAGWSHDSSPLYYTVVITNDENFGVEWDGDLWGCVRWYATGVNGDVEESYLYSKTGDVIYGHETQCGVGKNLADVELSSDYKYIEWTNDTVELVTTKTFSVPVGYFVWVFANSMNGNGPQLFIETDVMEEGVVDQSIYCITMPNQNLVSNITGFAQYGV